MKGFTKMQKNKSVLWLAAAILLAVSLCATIPSGMLTDKARNSYYDRMVNEESEWNEEECEKPNFFGLHPVAVLASAALTDILPGDVAPLPIDLLAPGGTPIEENFTENGYRDDTIIVDLVRERMYDSNVYIAYIQIASPTQLRTAVASGNINRMATAATSKMCENYNAVVGINGDYYFDTKGGFIIREEECYRKVLSPNMDLLLIDELGDFHIIKRGKENQQNAWDAITSAHTVVNGFFFGPGLVIDGKLQDDFDNYQFGPNSKQPRAGIAQLGVLTYMLVVVNGRDEAGDAAQGRLPSTGVTLPEFAQIMKELGAEQAYNLDGGNSASLCYHGRLFNEKPQKERDVTDIIYFASAVQP